MYVTFATTVKEYAGTLANYNVEFFGKFGNSSSRTCGFYMRGRTPVRSRERQVLGFAPALDATWLHSLVTSF